MDANYLKHKLHHDSNRLLSILKWIAFACLVGTILGAVGTLFCLGMNLVTSLRLNFPAFLLLLPIGAIIIRLLYAAFRKKNITTSATGTNLVLTAIQSQEEIPLRVAPLIFVSTIFSHLVGASVGREGAALQMGGSIGSAIGRLFHFKEQDKHTLIMCGMSAAFSAVFGTPMTAAVFSMEVVSVGIMHYAALVPCVISAFIARAIARRFGIADAHFILSKIPAFSVKTALITVAFAAICGIFSMLFCILLRKSEELSEAKIKNPYLRAFIFGGIVLIFTILIGDETYSGTGINLIERALAGDALTSYAFLLKIIFTVLSIVAGYRGGEIVPSFCIGATLGTLFGQLCGFPTESNILLAAIGLGAFFCGVTNCPITSLLLCLELFGMDAMPYFLLAVAISYMISGYYGLYSSQKILYSKYRSNYINKRTE